MTLLTVVKNTSLFALLCYLIRKMIVYISSCLYRYYTHVVLSKVMKVSRSCYFEKVSFPFSLFVQLQAALHGSNR